METVGTVRVCRRLATKPVACFSERPLAEMRATITKKEYDLFNLELLIRGHTVCGIFTREPALIDFFLAFSREELKKPTIVINIAAKEYEEGELVGNVIKALRANGEIIQGDRYWDFDRFLESKPHNLVLVIEENTPSSDALATFFEYIRALVADKSVVDIKVVVLEPVTSLSSLKGYTGQSGLGNRLTVFNPWRS